MTKSAGMRILALGLLLAAAGLAGCGTIDDALFAGSEEQATSPANTPPPAATPAPQPAEAANPAPAEASAVPPEGQAPAAVPGAAPPPPPVATAELTPPAAGGFTPITVTPGADTGSSVSHTIGDLRTELAGLETKLAANAQHFADLRNSDAHEVATFQQTTGEISAHLAAGTTRSNPELISQWNAAQGALDSLSGNINSLGQLASDVSKDTSTAHEEFDAIQGTLNVPGAVDEDHRQLTVLSDEAGETIVLLDRLFREVKQTLTRQTAYVAGERGHLTSLADAIKSGDYSLLPPQSRVAAASHETSSEVAAAVQSGGPIVTIKFDKNHVTYERLLYSALSQALATKPSASFNVIGVSPTGGSESAVQISQSSAERHAQDVMHTMGEMGVPAGRMQVASSTDPAISASEVRVYVR